MKPNLRAIVPDEKEKPLHFKTMAEIIGRPEQETKEFIQRVRPEVPDDLIDFTKKNYIPFFKKI
jgi:hypothetical protein